MKTTPAITPAKNFSPSISVYTEMPDIAVGRNFCGRVFYDANCSFCTGLLDRFGEIFERRGFVFVPLQDAIASGKFDITPAEFHHEMKLKCADGQWLGGADAWIELFNRVGYLRPIGVLATLPGFHAIAHAVYRRVAANRDCLNGACSIYNRSIAEAPRQAVNRKRNQPRFNRAIALLPMVVLPLAVLVVKPMLEPWIFMWALAFAIFAGCKWLTLIDAIRKGTVYNLINAAVYLFTWTGMNASKFPVRQINRKDKHYELGFALSKLLLGAAILWTVVPLLTAFHPLIIGWLGMAGVILMLHFGLFHVISIVLLRMGYNAPAMMNAPLLARTVAEFWGKRWNQSFHELTTNYLFRPAKRKLGSNWALMICFLASGLIHDLLITVPAGGGYGLPTTYFAIQGMGLLVERRLFGRKRHTIIHRAFAWLVVVAPVGLLFPPIFVEQIILPMLRAFGVY